LRRELRLTDIGYSRKVSYSQEYFADDPEGFYVDVGAYDPFNASNTLLLYRRGWHGINIEPDPNALSRLRRFRARDTNLGIAISEENGVVHFLLDGSFSRVDTSVDAPSHGITRIVVPSRRLEDVLSEVASGLEIDLLDVDCEGHDLSVLRSNDWQRFRPRLILAESHLDPPVDLETFMSEVGYQRVARFTLTYAFERG
jgi:FkbM family methyltransferase